MVITYKTARWTKNGGYETAVKTKSFTSATKVFEKWKADSNTERTVIRRYEGGASEIIV